MFCPLFFQPKKEAREGALDLKCKYIMQNTIMSNILKFLLMAAENFMESKLLPKLVI